MFLSDKLFNIFHSILFLALIFFCACSSDIEQPKSFIVAPGYQMSLVASEPIIKDPVDIEFDHQGNAYVLEMPGYPFENTQSRIIQLKDKNDFGLYENGVVFADNLELASSILPYKNGILVAAPPYLLHVVDTDDDGKADTRDTILGGFATGNLQHNYNGLSYSLDGWIYAGNGGNNGNLFWWDNPENKMELNGGDFRFRMDTKQLEVIGQSSGGFELAFDEYNRIYETHNTQHISQLVFPRRYSSGIELKQQHQLMNISDHEENGLARVYPIGEQETRVNHPEQSGYFSGACGITYYGGGHLAQLGQTIWIADVVLNLIHLDKLSDFGSRSQAERVGVKSDFIASTDRAFRPVNLTVGPNGAMYIVDMYREVIEHPEWIPDEIEAQLDLESGKDKGRIYAVTSHSSDVFPFDKQYFDEPLSTIKALGHPNQWIRLTAHRLLNESGLSKEQHQDLLTLFKSKEGYGFLHAMWILHTQGKLTVAQLIQSLNHANPGIRENALIIAESFIDNDDIQEKVIGLLTDVNERVRLQAALSSSQIQSSKIVDQIQEASQMNCDEFTKAALTIAAQHHPTRVIKEITNQSNVQLPLLESLVYTYTKSRTDLNDHINILVQRKLPDSTMSVLIAAVQPDSKRISNKNSISNIIEQIELSASLPLLTACAKLRQKLGLPQDAFITQYGNQALKTVTDKSNNLNSRIDHLAMLELMPYQKKSAALFSLLSNTEPLKLQEMAMNQLWTYEQPSIGREIITKWKDLGPQTRRMASDLLLYREINHDALLTALENGTINIGEMNFDLERRRTLLWWTDNEQTKTRAEALFSDAGVVNRKEVIHEMKEALALQGSVDQGSQLFDVLCGQCHLYKDQGNEVGPTLTEINRKSKESLIHEILDPNAAVDTRYINHRVKLVDGSSHLGIVDSETDTEIVIKKLGGQTIVIDKTDVDQLVSLGSSMMPEGLEQNLNHQEMADLLSFLQQGI